MEQKARLERLVIGLRGLGLLRAWPLGDGDEAAAQIDVIAHLLAHRDDPPMAEVLELHTYDHKDGYEAWADTYDDPGNALIDVEERTFRPILSALPPGDAVDVACGTGRLASMLCDLGHSVQGVDPSEAMIARARAKRLPVTFHLGRLDALPIASDSADLATCALALTHVTDLGPAVAELARIVRPSGRIVLSDVHPIAVATGAQAMFRHSDGSRGVTINYQHWVADYIRVFVDAGLVIERCEEPLVDEGFKLGLGSEDVRAAADLGLTGLPLLLIWVLRA